MRKRQNRRGKPHAVQAAPGTPNPAYDIFNRPIQELEFLQLAENKEPRVFLIAQKSEIPFWRYNAAITSKPKVLVSSPLATRHSPLQSAERR